MSKSRVFISSVQREFAAERQALAEYILGDKLLGQFFEPWLFEMLPASDQRADQVYLEAAGRCEIYLGLWGSEYGFENADRTSPTEQEYLAASQEHRYRVVLLRGEKDDRHPKMQALVEKAQSELVRHRFDSLSDLKTQVYSALVEYLMKRQSIQTAPFDAAANREAKLSDISDEKVRSFIESAKAKRGFPLSAGSSVPDVLTHLNLLRSGNLTNSALLLFGNDPQRWFVTSLVKCAHFHGTEIAKPILAQKDLRGDVFELIDQAADFVLSRIDVATGTRKASNDVPVTYEIPRTVILEAIVNAVAHRDYTSTGSVQVMLFKDRLEVWNPGHLPPSLSIDQLRKPHASFPANPLLAEPMYQLGYIERMGTGTGDMIRDCRQAGLPEPGFRQEDVFKTIIYRKAFTPQVTPQVTPQAEPESVVDIADIQSLVERVLWCISGEMSRVELMDVLELRDTNSFRDNYLNPALEEGLIEMTISRATSSNQKYRLTRKGKIRQTKMRKRYL